jgi:acetyl-CoA carboxylase biotin carboxyl carrier protein
VTLTAKDVAEITRLLEESSFDELYLELDGVKLSLKRGAAASRAAAPASGATAIASPAAAAPEPASSHSGSTPPAGNGVDPSLHNITSPLLGTFYRAPKPGAPPYVEVGSPVQEDTIVGIIEVMKLMNTVRAGTRGRVVEILARDGTLVEYGETLLRVGKPDRL